LAEDLLEALEVRIAIESEAAALAARRRTTEQLAAIQAACDAMDAALARGEETVALDIAFHRSIAEATGQPAFRWPLHLPRRGADDAGAVVGVGRADVEEPL
jgi:DNA-binding FadR family transcriptional regulator